jgi:hypothetical protein
MEATKKGNFNAETERAERKTGKLFGLMLKP